MKLNKASTFFATFIVLCGITLVLVPGGRISATGERKPRQAKPLDAGTAAPSVEFEENLGQFDEEVRFVAETSTYTLFLTDSEAVYVYPLTDGKRDDRLASDTPSPDDRYEVPRASTSRVFVLRMKLGRTLNRLRISGENKTEHVKNYFRGSDPSRWQPNVGNYRGVRYDNVYDGISLVWGSVVEGGVSLAVEIDEDADASQMALAFEGAQAVETDADANLLIRTDVGTFTQRAPIARRVASGSVKETRSEFRIDDGLAKLYDSKSLLPQGAPVENLSSMGFSTYLGSKLDDYGDAIALDGSSNIYVTGYTESPFFPTTSGVIDISPNGQSDVFVTKMRSSGNALIYSTFLGGAGTELGQGIAVDASGNAYITGRTGVSTGAAFPVTTGAFDVTHNGSSDAFVTKINASGSSIIYSTLLGGSSIDEGDDIKVDASGNAYIVGTTDDGPPDFPTTVGAYDTTHNNAFDVFVTSLNPSGTSLRYSTFIGGGNNDYGHSLALDSDRNVYLTGATQGGATRFPTTVGAYDMSPNGFYDAFVTKLNSTGTALVYSTFIGGDADDESFDIAIDSNRQAYITGRTGQTGSVSYPTTFLAFQQFSTDDGTDAFVTKINRMGTGLIFSTFLYGTSSDEGHAIEVDSAEDVYIAGATYDDVTDFPTTPGAFDRTHNGLFDVFVTKLRSDGRALLYSTLAGGSQWDSASGIVIDSRGSVYITGYTQDGDPEYPVTPGAYDIAQNGNRDAFITKFAGP